jgi:hypothetical protein
VSHWGSFWQFVDQILSFLHLWCNRWVLPAHPCVQILRFSLAKHYFTCRYGHPLSWHKSCSQHSSTNETCSHIFLELLSFVCYSLDHNTSSYSHPCLVMFCYTFDRACLQHTFQRSMNGNSLYFVIQNVHLRFVAFFIVV